MSTEAIATDPQRALREMWAGIKAEMEKLTAALIEWVQTVLAPTLARLVAFLDEIGYLRRYRSRKVARISRMHSAYARRRR